MNVCVCICIYIYMCVCVSLCVLSSSIFQLLVAAAIFSLAAAILVM